MKKIIGIFIMAVFFAQSTGVSYALRPQSVAKTQESQTGISRRDALKAGAGIIGGIIGGGTILTSLIYSLHDKPIEPHLLTQTPSDVLSLSETNTSEIQALLNLKNTIASSATITPTDIESILYDLSVYSKKRGRGDATAFWIAGSEDGYVNFYITVYHAIADADNMSLAHEHHWRDTFSPGVVAVDVENDLALLVSYNKRNQNAPTGLELGLNFKKAEAGEPIEAFLDTEVRWYRDFAGEHIFRGLDPLGSGKDIVLSTLDIKTNLWAKSSGLVLNNAGPNWYTITGDSNSFYGRTITYGVKYGESFITSLPALYNGDSGLPIFHPNKDNKYNLVGVLTGVCAYKQVYELHSQNTEEKGEIQVVEPVGVQINIIRNFLHRYLNGDPFVCTNNDPRTRILVDTLLNNNDSRAVKQAIVDATGNFESQVINALQRIAENGDHYPLNIQKEAIKALSKISANKTLSKKENSSFLNTYTPAFLAALNSAA